MTIEDRLAQLEEKINELEKIAHAPRNFVTCEECKKRIIEKTNNG